MSASEAWPFWVGGVGIGVLVVLLAWICGKGFGVSTSYGSMCSLLSGLSYFKTKPFTESWRLWFLVGLPLGGLLSAALSGDLHLKTQIGMFEQVFGDTWLAKGIVLIAGGFLVGYGSRWAGG